MRLDALGRPMLIGARGRFQPLPTTSCAETALARFAKKCRHDPVTNCVLWTGGTTQGRGHYQPYGSFKFNRRRWFAHRWAAKYIHGLEIDDQQVDHCCPFLVTPNTLCVEHLQPRTNDENNKLKWIRIQKGAEPYPFPPFVGDEFGAPFFLPPAWLAPFILKELSIDAPF